RQFVEHCFDHGIAAGIVQAGKDERIVIWIKLKHSFARHSSLENHARVEAKLCHAPLQCSKIIAIANDCKRRVGFGELQRVYCKIDSFEANDVADVEQSKRAIVLSMRLIRQLLCS